MEAHRAEVAPEPALEEAADRARQAARAQLRSRWRLPLESTERDALGFLLVEISDRSGRALRLDPGRTGPLERDPAAQAALPTLDTLAIEA
jgi:hypothetical protein